MNGSMNGTSPRLVRTLGASASALAVAATSLFAGGCNLADTTGPAGFGVTQGPSNPDARPNTPRSTGGQSPSDYVPDARMQSEIDRLTNENQRLRRQLDSARDELAQLRGS
ncbi:MAG: hypothetical protein AAF612_00450 [Planctomycetota bacterium]